MTTAGGIELSIVIPAFNEARKIARDVQAAAAFLQGHGIAGEIIVADDGSSDGTAEAAEAVAVPPGVERRVIRSQHAGKGSAVRHGMQATRGQLVMFADSGVCVPFEDALPALELLRRGQFDIANGSRKLPASVIAKPQGLYRRLLSSIFRRAALRYLHLPRGLSDTQCGFKVYRGEAARELYGECVTDGFMFDLEVLARARAKGYRITEIPVHWTCDRDSRLKPSRLLGRTLRELRAIKARLGG